jgi:tRNA(adenine34) deaminase
LLSSGLYKNVDPFKTMKIPTDPKRFGEENSDGDRPQISDRVSNGFAVLASSSNSDELWMEEALRCAERALEYDEVPVGAVVICDGRIVGRGWNRNITDNDPTAHAEIVALREAGRNIGNHRLLGCDLFATIEPCAMCAGAAIHARVKRLVYGADDEKAGAVRSALQVANHPRLNHQMETRGGVLAGRAAEILQDFFRNRR